MRGTTVFAAVAGALALGGCISTGPETPEWFAERSAENDSSYPSLRDVPRETTANTSARYWSRVEENLVEAGEQVRAHPRAQPATTTEDPAAFIEEAREDLEETRQAHEP